MKEIPLTRGKVALVDDEDYDYLMQWKWFCSAYGYAVRNQPYITISGEKKRKAMWMHRVIINAPDNLFVDHRWGDKLDNRKENLRLCTKSQNQANRVHSNNISGFKGVIWHKVKSKWQAYVKLNSRQIHLGYFNDKIEAAKAYNSAAFEYFGEFALLNKISA